MKASPCLALISLLATSAAGATDILYKKSLALYVIHDVESGNYQGVHLDRPVGQYATDSGGLAYLKGTSLFLIRDTRKPQPELIDTLVSDMKFDGGVIAYRKSGSLYVRRLAADARTPSLLVPESQNCSAFEVTNGKIIFLKGLHQLYHVTDLDSGAVVQLASPAGEAQIAR